MQWSPDRNGGFSGADFAQLYLPPLMDPVYGYGAVNVEAQMRNPGSFLHWLRRMFVQRRSMPVLGIGRIEVLDCANPSVLAFVRWGEVADVSVGPADGPGLPPVMPSVAGPERMPDAVAPARTVPARPGEPRGAPTRSQVVLCVHNLSRFAQPAMLDLAAWQGRRPVEVLGRVPFPPIGAEPYPLALGPHGFLWFELAEHVDVLEEAGP